MTHLSQRYRPLPDVRFRIIANEAVVVKQRSAELLVLNEVGARILELLNGERTAAQVLQILGEEFNAETTVLEDDLQRFLKELTEAGLVELATV